MALLKFDAVCIRLQARFTTLHDYPQPLLIWCSISSPKMTHSASIVIPLFPSPQFGKFPSHITTQPHTFRHLQVLSNLDFSSIQPQTILNIPSTSAPLKEEPYCLIIWKEEKNVKIKVWKQRNVSVVLIRARLFWLEHFKVKSVLEWPFSSPHCSTMCVFP